METGFVYIWFDRKHKRYYIGSHWGTTEDGYVCSSTWMRNAYNRRPEDFTRKILKMGIDRSDLIQEEQLWLDLIRPDEIGKRYYNLNKNAIKHWHTDPQQRLTVGQKISSSPNRATNISKALKARGHKPSEYAQRRKLAAITGRVQTAEEKLKRIESRSWYVHSDNTKEKIANAHIGKIKPRLSEEHKAKISSKAAGRKHTKYTREKMSLSGRGKHGGTVAVTDINGINTRISKQMFDEQKVGPVESWPYVSVTSKESKRRRAIA